MRDISEGPRVFQGIPGGPRELFQGIARGFRVLKGVLSSFKESQVLPRMFQWVSGTFYKVSWSSKEISRSFRRGILMVPAWVLKAFKGHPGGKGYKEVPG